MTSTTTICAISTPAGVGGIAVVRISGPQALHITARIWQGKDPRTWASHTAHLGCIVDPQNNETIDQAVATLFLAPNSFTGEHVVELSVHGSRWVQQEILNLLIRQGCQIAQPGEFTRRAFANGRLDLAQAEAVADLIASQSRAANRLALNQMRGRFSSTLANLRGQLLDLASLLELELDFSEEDVEFADRRQLLQLARHTLATVDSLAATFALGNAIRNGVPVAIIGQPNAGKSSLLNALLGDDRAIVSDIPGTTRDTIEDTATIADLQFRFIDTAGLRHTTDTIEQLGIDRTLTAANRADIIIYIIPADQLPLPGQHLPQPIAQALTAQAPIIIAVNKTDLLPQPLTPDQLNALATLLPTPPAAIIPISAKTGHNLPLLRSALLRCAPGHLPAPAPHTPQAAPLDGTPHTPQAAPLDGTPDMPQVAPLDGTPDIPQGDISDATQTDMVIVTNARHYQALTDTSAALRRTIAALSANLSGDLVAQDLREALHHLGTITGAITTPDILSTIFSRFCIGK